MALVYAKYDSNLTSNIQTQLKGLLLTLMGELSIHVLWNKMIAIVDVRV